MTSHRAIVAGVTAFMFLNFVGLTNADEKKIEVKKTEATVKNVQDKAAARGMVHRASEIAGMTVKDSAGKELGTVKDTVINVTSGQIDYAALSYGGFLGLGDKLFAVPFDAFTHSHDVSADKHFLVLNVDEGTLKRAPGFDPNKWPNFADPQFSTGINKYYHKFRTPRGGLTIESKPGEIKVAVNPNPSATANSSQPILHRASHIMGMTVRNAAGKELGSVNDLVIDMESGKARYAALSYGGFLGLGDKLFAVPWSAFDCQYNAGSKEYHMLLNIDEATLRKASGFNKDAWPNFADPMISDQIDKHYRSTSTSPRGVTPVAAGTNR